MERSPIYKGLTIDRFLHKTQIEGEPWGTIEVEIMSVKHRTSRVKEGSNRQPVEFWNVEVQDSNSKEMTVNFWQDDHLRFRDDLKKGTLVRMEVKPPSGGYRTLTFNAPQKHLRAKSLPKNREDDMRLVVLPPGESENVDLTDFSPEA